MLLVWLRAARPGSGACSAWLSFQRGRGWCREHCPPNPSCYSQYP